MSQESWCLRRHGVSGDMVSQETWCFRRHGVSGDMVSQETGVALGELVAFSLNNMKFQEFDFCQIPLTP